MYFVFNKSHMFVRLNLVANLYLIYVNNTLPPVLVCTKFPDIFQLPITHGLTLIDPRPVNNFICPLLVRKVLPILNFF